MRLPRPVYGVYERRLAASLPRVAIPRHVGVILDGNRRWARSFGEPASTGHRRGADKISELLTWSEEVGVEVVTLWMLSTDNLKREADELRAAQQRTASVRGLHVNVAIGYGGRHEIVDAVRSLLREHAERGTTLEQLADSLELDHITANLYTRGQPDPDLVIRTSGEQRLGGFLLWQSAHSEFYFCEAYWPDFRRVDFLRALRSYAERERRLGR